MVDDTENPWHEKIAKSEHESYNIIISSVENGFSAHWHKEIEIVYIIEGSMQIGLNAVRYPLNRGDILFIGSCDIHRYYPNPLGCTKIILQLDKSVFGDYADQMVNRKFTMPHISPECSLPAGASNSCRLHWSSSYLASMRRQSKNCRDTSWRAKPAFMICQQF